MTQIRTRFSDGPAGLALLLMRLAQAATGLAIASGLPGWIGTVAHPELLTALLGVLLLVGLYVRPAAIVLALLGALAASSWSGPARCLLLANACSGLALALLGAGAYSLDARLFGRRVIDLTERRPGVGREQRPPKP